MKTEVKKVDSTRREINIEVSGEIIKNKFEDVFKKIQQEAKISGFRPGHAPRDIIEKKYSSVLHEQVLKELIPEIYTKAVEKESLDVIDMPNISDVKLDREKLVFKAEVEVTPEIEIKDYKGIKLDYKKVEVTADDIKRSIDSLKESRKAEAVDDSFAKGLGYPDLATLEKVLEMQIYIQKYNQNHKALEDKIIEEITKDLEFKVPESLVTRQLNEMVRQAKLDMALKGVHVDKANEQDKSLVQELSPVAKKQVKVYLVLSRIAKNENIPLDDNMAQKVIELLFKLANWG